MLYFEINNNITIITITFRAYIRFYFMEEKLIENNRLYLEQKS
jgi:hypothetical protein